jgi:3',5'-cyclic AMP phosphodiesterase CpdA
LARSPAALLAQLSDPHIRLGPDDDGTGAALAASVAAVAALDPQPDALLLSGDLAEHAHPREYERVRELLRPLTLPVHALPGNHDERAVLRAHFDIPREGELVQYAVSCGALRLVACDSTIPGHDSGSLAPDRLALLDELLGEDTSTPTIVAMHHPPFLIGAPALDRIGVPEPERAALGELLARHPQVKRVTAGHVHRAATGRVGNCPAITSPSNWRQSALDLRPDSELAFADADPPGFVLHVLTSDGELASHVQPI